MSAAAWPEAALELIHSVMEHLTPQIRPLTGANAFFALLLPFLPLDLQAYYLQFQGTRPIRIALAGVGISLVAHAAMTYRILIPEYSAFNVGLHVTYLHIFGKYVEFASLSEPVIDPYLAKGRSRILSAVDLCINSRWIGLRPVFPEEARVAAPEAQTSSQNGQANGVPNAAANGVAQSELKAPAVDQSRWLFPPTIRRTRWQATLRHFLLFTKHFAICDTLLLFMRVLASDSIGSVSPPPDAWQKFIDTPFTLLPHTPLAWRLPKLAIVFLTEMWIGTFIWQILCNGYHFFALLGVGSGIWEVESWEADLMYEPWKSDSLLDLWGRGWHQLFRHHFLVLSIFILRTLRLNPRGPLLLPLIFTWSAALHVIAGHVVLAHAPGHDTWSLFSTGAFFLLSGVGCSLELLFRRLTGRRVRGWWGQVWLWTWFTLAAYPVARTWMPVGICGNLFTGPGTLGWLILPLVRRVVDVVR